MSPRKFAVTMAPWTVHGEDYGVPDVAAVIVGGHLFADVEVTEVAPLPPDVGEIQVVVLPAIQGALREWLESRGLHLFPIPVEDDLPTFGIGVNP